MLFWIILLFSYMCYCLQNFRPRHSHIYTEKLNIIQHSLSTDTIFTEKNLRSFAFQRNARRTGAFMELLNGKCNNNNLLQFALHNSYTGSWLIFILAQFEGHMVDLVVVVSKPTLFNGEKLSTGISSD